MMIDFVCEASSSGLLGDAGLWGLVAFAANLLFWLGLFAVVVTVLVRWRARVPAGSSPRLSGRPSAKEILQSRYARGEISREQYERMRSSIK